MDVTQRVRTGVSRRAALIGAASLAGIPGAVRARVPDTLRFALAATPPNLLPLTNAGTTASTVKVQIYRGLLGLDAEGRVRPDVAETWTREAPLVHQFKLRENAKFHNGDPVTAEDVKFTLEQILAERSTAFLKADFARAVERLEIVDRLTVKFHLKEPSATFHHLLSSWHAPIISARSPAANPIGCGPFRVTGMERGTRVELERFTDFYRPGRPRVGKLHFIAYPDENLRVAALQTGDVDLIEYVPWPNMEQVQRNPALTLDTVDGPFMFLVFNVTRPPFNDVRLRQAVALSVRREDIVRAAFAGRGTPLEGIPYVRSWPFYDAERGRFWRRDLDRARALMAEAGHPNGFQATLLSSSTYNFVKDTSEVVQQSLRDAGIQVQLHLPDWPTHVQLGNRGQYDFHVMGSAGEFDDPDSLGAYFGGGSPSFIRPAGYQNPRIVELLGQGRVELDLERRKAIYAEIERLALADAAIVGLAWRSQGYGFHRYVQGFRNLPGFLTFRSGFVLEDVALA